MYLKEILLHEELHEYTAWIIRREILLVIRTCTSHFSPKGSMPAIPIGHAPHKTLHTSWWMSSSQRSGSQWAALWFSSSVPKESIQLSHPKLSTLRECIQQQELTAWHHVHTVMMIHVAMQIFVVHVKRKPTCSRARWIYYHKSLELKTKTSFKKVGRTAAWSLDSCTRPPIMFIYELLWLYQST